MKIEENVSLKNINTFGIDVKAKYFAEIKTLEDTKKIPSIIKKLNTDFLILGGGSNILFTKDFEGIVFHNIQKGIELVKEDKEYIWVKAQSGENWHEFVLHCLKKGWAGIENLSLIPGSVGATPIQNIGAYGVELKNVFHELEAIDLKTGKRKVFDNESCEFGYRDSIFKRHAKGKYYIDNVTLRLYKKPRFNTSYGAIDQELDLLGIKKPTIKQVSKAVINIRKSKLPDPKKRGNAGSFFKNPVITDEEYQKLKLDFPDMPHYRSGENHVKIPAGWLIDQAGWKGKDYGSYGVHDKQALVLINKNNAKGKDIQKLSERIQRNIKKIYGISLEREVNIL